mmetsp:Transcript_13524/g.31807  ORF Transcript_13524/g.31807 Transcript_13524/m.31807 type:complete len:162 (-) Transcript_13524:182-667(-)
MSAVEFDLVDLTKESDGTSQQLDHQVSPQTPSSPAVVIDIATTNTPTETCTDQLEVTNEDAPVQQLSPMKPRGRQRIHHIQQVNFNSDCFSISKKNGARSKAAAKKAKTRAVKRIVEAVLDDSLTGEQQVLAFRLALKHKLMKIHTASAALFVRGENDLED